MDKLYEGRAFEAQLSLGLAVQCLKNSCIWIADSAAEVEGYPAENRILSLAKGVEDMINAISKERERLGKEETENAESVLL